MKIIMKKEYIKPDLEIFEIKASTLLAGSDPENINSSNGDDINTGYVD